MKFRELSCTISIIVGWIIFVPALFEHNTFFMVVATFFIINGQVANKQEQSNEK